MTKMRMLTLAFAFAAASIGARAGAAPAQVSVGKNSNLGTFITFGPTVTCADGSTGNAFGIGFVFASESVTIQQGAPVLNNGVSVDIFSYSDSCGNFIGFGGGGLAGGYTAPNPSLRSAAVSGNLTVQDFDTGVVFPVSVNLAFTGDGPVSISNGTNVTHDAGAYKVIVSRDASRSRTANVAGKITINGAEPDASFSSTTLSLNASTQVLVQQQN